MGWCCFKDCGLEFWRPLVQYPRFLQVNNVARFLEAQSNCKVRHDAWSLNFGFLALTSGLPDVAPGIRKQFYISNVLCAKPVPQVKAWLVAVVISNLNIEILIFGSFLFPYCFLIVSLLFPLPSRDRIRWDTYILGTNSQLAGTGTVEYYTCMYVSVYLAERSGRYVLCIIFSSSLPWSSNRQTKEKIRRVTLSKKFYVRK